MKTRSCGVKSWLFLLLLSITRGEQISDVAQNLSSTFNNLFNRSTRYHDLLQIYIEDASGADVYKANGFDIINELSSNALNRISKIHSTLLDTAEIVEDLYTWHSEEGCCSVQCNKTSSMFDRQICSTQCNYSNTDHPLMTNIEEVDLTYSPFFKIEVNTSRAIDFIPINIYDQDPSILCFAEWSENLTDVFIQKSKEISKHYASSIFLGDKSGAIKSAPAVDFGNDSTSCTTCPFGCVNTYDPRNRPWYIGSASGTKHVAILIDHSGSMAGSSWRRASLASSELIINLNANDFFTVYIVDGDNDSRLLSPCEDEGEFLQASPENKLAVSKLISSLGTTTGKADFTTSLYDAYKKLENSSACYKLIFLFSDGNAEIPVDIPNDEGEVIVFTFLVNLFGKEDKLKELAKNNGRFTLLDDFNSIGLGSRVMVDELNRRTPDVKSTIFTQHTDVISNSLVISMSLPIKPNETDFIGVLCLEILENLFEQLVLLAKIDPYGYSILVTNNGHLYRHPLMDSSVLEYFDSLQSFDFSQYEFICDHTSAEELRTAIVNDETGTKDALSYITIEHKKRYLLKNFTYYYQPMRPDIRVVLKLPSEGVYRLNYTTSTLNTTLLEQINHTLSNGNLRDSTILINVFQPNCFGEIWYTLNTHGDAVRFLLLVIQEYLSNGTISCEPTITEPILRDLINVYQVTKGLTIASPVISTFFWFISGLLYCVQPSDGSLSFQCRNITSVNFIALADDDPTRLLILRGTEDSVLFETVQLIRSITIPTSSVGVAGISVGVAGIILQPSYVNDLLVPYSSLNSTLYLVDEGGYSVGSSCYDNNSTSFLGSHRSNLFDRLVNNSIYTRQKVTGYHKRFCKSSDDSSTVEDRGSTSTTTCDVSKVLDLCVSDIIFYVLNNSVSSELITGYGVVVNVPDTSLIVVSSSPGCVEGNTTEGNAITQRGEGYATPQEASSNYYHGEYETRDYPKYFTRSPSTQTCLSIDTDSNEYTQHTS